MSLTYRTTDLARWGTGKGSDLEPDEVDLNFWELLQQVQALGAATGVGIDYISQDSATTFVIHLTDHTTQGPFTIPTATWSWQGVWTASAVYAAFDVVTYNGATYLVLQGHVASASFDPNATDGTGHNLYAEILANPLPTGGAAGQFLVKGSGTDFDVAWVTIELSSLEDIALTSPANLGEVLTWDGTVWTNKPKTPSVQTQTDTSWVPTESDANTYNRFTNGSTVTVQVPTSASTDFPIGTEIHGVQFGSGTVMIEGLSGVTINLQDSSLPQTSGIGAVFTLKKVDTDEWDLFGRLEGASP